LHYYFRLFLANQESSSSLKTVQNLVQIGQLYWHTLYIIILQKLGQGER